MNEPLLCKRVAEELESLLDGRLEGKLDDPLGEHLASCDACRDLRHDAMAARRLVVDAGADYAAPKDLADLVLSRLEHRRGETSTDGEPAQPASSGDDKEGAASAPSGESVPIPAFAADDLRASRGRSTHQGSARREAAPRTGGASWLRRPARVATLAVAAALATAAAVLLWPAEKTPDETADVTTGWHGTVARVVRGGGAGSGLAVCAVPEDASTCGSGDDGAPLPAGAKVRTDDRTRAQLAMADGTTMTLDRSSEVVLERGVSRGATLTTGALIADVVRVEASPATLRVPRGRVEVLGTKLALRVVGDSVSVDVTRGAVELFDDKERSVRVRAGEAGRSFAGAAPWVSSSPRLGDALAFEEVTTESRAARGLGELKAKKPGSDDERSAAVRLSKHQVKTRIVDGFARTEVEEEFRNDTDDVLEGIYRFPLPPGAQIERLALDVDGKLEEGAYVDRDRAMAIWRGAIVNSGGRPKPREEIVWVPGPWKDPALLEQQRGGRFELRIFPIPKRGSRRVVIGYTESVAAAGGVRRYVYPLPFDPSGSTTVDAFSVDLEVRGHDRALGVRSFGYDLLQKEDGEASALSFSRQGFTPSGDLVVEYGSETRGRELTAWAYRDSSVTTAVSPNATADARRAAPSAANAATMAKRAAPPGDRAPTAAVERATAGYLTMALRPNLPRAEREAERAFVFVVDASRSMYGERYRRAVALASRTVAELDAFDRFTVLACDTVCQGLGGELRAAGLEASRDVAAFLTGITPDGGSDVAESIAEAAKFASRAEGRELHVVYLGDGAPTVGPILPALVTEAVRTSLPAGRSSLTAVAVGADADRESLLALARGGGGTVISDDPLRSVGEIAYAVLGASYGRALRDVSLELPPGVDEVSPARLDAIAPGSEVLVSARLTSPDLQGEAVLRGKVGSVAFEQRYPLAIRATAVVGNAFVPRVFAAQRIADLERDGSAAARARAITLSSRFSVASRYTSLLVLESEAMFRAFGLDNDRRAPEWTGEEIATADATAGPETAIPESASPDDAERDSAAAAASRAFGGGQVESANADDLGDLAGASGFGKFGGAGEPSAGHAGPSPPAAVAPRAPPAPVAENRPAPPAKRKGGTRACSPGDPLCGVEEPLDEDRWRDRGRRQTTTMRPMRVTWERTASVSPSASPTRASGEAVNAAEREHAAAELKRASLKKLYSLYAQSGDIGRASSLVERWVAKEPLDPDALTARADLAARRGDRDAAIRILGGVVDVRPGDVGALERLARLHRWQAAPRLACRYRIAAAQVRRGDARLLGEATSCARAEGQSTLERLLLDAAEPAVRDAAVRLASRAAAPDVVSGEVRLELAWSGGGDLDLSLVNQDGSRISWLGAPSKEVITARDVVHPSRETLGVLGTLAGEYLIEVVRARGEGRQAGTVTVIGPGGLRQALPFVLDGARATVGTLRVGWKRTLVPAW